MERHSRHSENKVWKKILQALVHVVYSENIDIVLSEVFSSYVINNYYVRLGEIYKTFSFAVIQLHSNATGNCIAFG